MSTSWSNSVNRNKLQELRVVQTLPQRFCFPKDHTFPSITELTLPQRFCFPKDHTFPSITELTRYSPLGHLLKVTASVTHRFQPFQ